MGPMGKKLFVSGSIMYATTPHAMALDSPQRVVSVHNSDATSWDYSCGSGACSAYYGDYVAQTEVDAMVEKGLMELTRKTSAMQAWQTLLPDYQQGQKIAIKVNFNDAIMGGGTKGYADNDNYVDALPQIINSVVKGLKDIGVQESDIWVFDASRYITNRFRERINYSGIAYYDNHGNGNDVQLAEFNSNDPTAQIDFTDSGYTRSHKVTDVLINTNYLINIPILKRHGGTGITLSMKNHLGSIDGFFTGSNRMHRYFYLNGSNYLSDVNPLVDINNNTNIKDKTILIIGDGLFGTWPDNNEPPRQWDSFNQDSPNMMFFGVDPVATDSVMYDYLQREGSFDAKAEDILIIAANSGMGVNERWNNENDREYTAINYVEVDTDTGLCKGCMTDNTPDIAVSDSIAPANDLQVPFGNVTVGSSLNQTVTITNNGNANLLIGTIAQINPIDAPFSISDTCSGQTLQPSASCTIAISFAPNSTGAFSDSFNIPSDDPDDNSVTITLSGTGNQLSVPDITVTDSIAPANDLQVPFGNVTVGSSSNQTVTVTNNGNANLIIGSIAQINPLDAPFSTSDTCSEQTLQPSASCTIAISFAPNSTGAFNDSFNIPSDDPYENSVTISLSGTGLSSSNNNPPSIPKLIFPANGQTDLGTTIEFTWEESSDPDLNSIKYDLYISNDPEFINSQREHIASLEIYNIYLGGTATSFLLFGIIFTGNLKHKKITMLLSTIIIIAMILVSCGGSGNDDAENNFISTTGVVQKEISGLNSESTYYWKIVADDRNGGIMESEVRIFTTF